MFGVSCTLGMRMCLPQAQAHPSCLVLRCWGVSYCSLISGTGGNGHKGLHAVPEMFNHKAAAQQGTHIGSLDACHIKPVYRQRCTYATNATPCTNPSVAPLFSGGAVERQAGRCHITLPIASKGGKLPAWHRIETSKLKYNQVYIHTLKLVVQLL
jgi:hypothetical protein